MAYISSMVSVENFYWVLFHNLLAPTGLDAWYYAPFGTRENLIRHQFSCQKIKENQHVLFHFDQEPLYSTYLGDAYENDHSNYNSKVLRILANSERSNIKKKICQDTGMSDWYFFYHGFAALDWFRDTQYISDRSPDFCSVYLMLNHLVKGKRSYRMSLVARLLQQQLVPFGKISFHGTNQDCWQELNDANTQLSLQSQQIIYQNLCDNRHLPWVLDSREIDGTWSARMGHQEYQLWQNAFLHVVPETIFYDSKLHLTEKVFKPIVTQRPFILVSAPNNLAYLRSYGFKTFGNWIDETYDTVTDDDHRLDLITQEISKLCSKSHRELQEIYQDMTTVLMHNKMHFFGLFREIIIDELVNNFDRCIRLWNNGRIDGRTMPTVPDLESVKRRLAV